MGALAPLSLFSYETQGTHCLAWLSSIYSTFTHTMPAFHLQHTYMKCLDSFSTFSHITFFFPNNCNKFLPSFFTFYLSCSPPFPSLSLLFLFHSHSHLASFSQNPRPVCCQRGEEYDRAVISTFPCLRPLKLWLNMTFQASSFGFVNYLFCKDLFCIKQDVST